MRTILKSSFLWQFAGGFLLGAVGLLTLQPADAAHHVGGYDTASPQR